MGAVATVEEIAAKEWVLQHCYFSSAQQVEAYKQYGFHITTSASFVYGKSQRVAEKSPESLGHDFIAMRRFVDQGLNLACGTDWGPDNPWRQMALIATRWRSRPGAWRKSRCCERWLMALRSSIGAHFKVTR